MEYLQACTAVKAACDAVEPPDRDRLYRKVPDHLGAWHGAHIRLEKLTSHVSEGMAGMAGRSIMVGWDAWVVAEVMTLCGKLDSLVECVSPLTKEISAYGALSPSRGRSDHDALAAGATEGWQTVSGRARKRAGRDQGGSPSLHGQPEAVRGRMAVLPTRGLTPSRLMRPPPMRSATWGGGSPKKGGRVSSEGTIRCCFGWPNWRCRERRFW
jgi:hypothetical protein